MSDDNVGDRGNRITFPYQHRILGEADLQDLAISQDQLVRLIHDGQSSR